ncbi:MULTISPECIES: lipoprotein [unclassified Streptomyces]|uniref:lipoprotein n=1 Tax=unclassified Streptomyces TaxID=2593676 RepID=UPI0022555783|nr:MULTISPECIES: lipoprotein [unclassified Streptomyces]MCX5140814.1 lipoprotein [Streptomyces sp. NBC_00338]WRZ65335.1 lipoprotein [Streptomyces sp. NBC_01257]WSU59335.1 lipoprotein [Streptomyces sp. NBC_01104]
MTGMAVRGLAPVLLAAVALTGCSSESGGGARVDTKPGGTAAGKTAGGSAAKGGTVGGSGSGCELPVVFDLAQHWKAKAVVADEPGSEFAAFSRQGPVAMVCEIDAKPAGHIGFLRVWQGDGKAGTPRQALEGFVKADENASKITYKETTAGKLAVTEVGYTVYSKVMEESRPARAFAVATPDGPVVVHLGGLDAQEHQGMLPAFELAERSVRLG